MQVSSLATVMWRMARKNAGAVHNWVIVNRRKILTSAGAFLTLCAAVTTFQLYVAYAQYAAYLDLQLANQPRIQSGRFVDFDQFPSVLVKALIAIEDRNFFPHSGLDLRGICRAFVKNQWQGKTREGGSTITQQLIKMQFLTPRRAWKRKFTEAIMALAIERRLSKKQIFALYADRVYLGHSVRQWFMGLNKRHMSFLVRNYLSFRWEKLLCSPDWRKLQTVIRRTATPKRRWQGVT